MCYLIIYSKMFLVIFKSFEQISAVWGERTLKLCFVNLYVIVKIMQKLMKWCGYAYP